MRTNYTNKVYTDEVYGLRLANKKIILFFSLEFSFSHFTTDLELLSSLPYAPTSKLLFIVSLGPATTTSPLLLFRFQSESNRRLSRLVVSFSLCLSCTPTCIWAASFLFPPFLSSTHLDICSAPQPTLHATRGPDTPLP